MGCPRGQQGSWRHTEGGGDGDEVVYVAAASAAFSAAEGGVGYGAPEGGAALGELLLGEAAREAQALDIARGSDSGGAYFNWSGSHDG